MSRALDISVRTISRGIRELESGQERLDPERVRRLGGGRKSLVQKDETLVEDLEALVRPGTGGDPCSPLRWTCKSLRNLEAGLRALGHSVSSWAVGQLLREAGYSLQGNMKSKEGKRHPDRNAQFEHINRAVRARQRTGEPVISVDAKKKELVGNFKNSGRQWRPAGFPQSPGPRLCDSSQRQGGAVWDLRSVAKRGMGERRDRPRHGGVRGS